MTNIDIFSGFLGAGKTTLIKKLIKESFAGQKVVLIENEFGEIGIDGGFLKESGIQIKKCRCRTSRNHVHNQKNHTRYNEEHRDQRDRKSVV